MKAVKKSGLWAFLFGYTPNKMACHVEISLLIRFANRFSGFHMTQASTDKNLRTRILK